MYTLDELNKMSDVQFTDVLGDIFEKSPWVAQLAAEARPYVSIQALYDQMVAIVKRATFNQQLQLIQSHPNLGERVQMSELSTKEQQQAGLKSLSEEEFIDFLNANQIYMEKFEFPFIIAVRGKSKDEIYQAMLARLEHDQETEFQTALEQIYAIAKFRLEEIF